MKGQTSSFRRQLFNLEKIDQNLIPRVGVDLARRYRNFGETSFVDTNVTEKLKNFTKFLRRSWGEDPLFAPVFFLAVVCVHPKGLKCTPLGIELWLKKLASVENKIN
jgi:hypothetical protein